MTAREQSALPTVYIPTPRPVEAWHCPSCGIDPRLIWDGHYVAGWDETLGINCAGWLCKECAESAAPFHDRYLRRISAEVEKAVNA